MRVTWHHNHFDGTSVRNPRFHFGRAHLFNNLWSDWWQYGAASYDNAQLFSEANIFRPAENCAGIPNVLPCEDENPCGDDNDWVVDRQKAIVSEGKDNVRGAVRSVGDLTHGASTVQVHRAGDVFDPGDTYDYDAEAANDALEARIREGVGPRVDWRE
jgi:pectate lyase